MKTGLAMAQFAGTMYMNVMSGRMMMSAMGGQMIGEAISGSSVACAASLPGAWITTDVQHREHRDQIPHSREEDRVRKLMDQGAPNIVF